MLMLTGVPVGTLRMNSPFPLVRTDWSPYDAVACCTTRPFEASFTTPVIGMVGPATGGATACLRAGAGCAAQAAEAMSTPIASTHVLPVKRETWVMNKSPLRGGAAASQLQ